MISPERAITLLVGVLSRHTFSYIDEKRCQQQMADVFQSVSLNCKKEHDFGQGVGVCDFFFPKSGIVVEAKAFKSWSKRQVYRQCERYCLQEEVKGLILATGKAQGLPREINGKPVRVNQLGIGSL
jgi:hypothetical protein